MPFSNHEMAFSSRNYDRAQEFLLALQLYHAGKATDLSSGWFAGDRFARMAIAACLCDRQHLARRRQRHHHYKIF